MRVTQGTFSFLPDLTELSVEVALAEERGEVDERAATLLTHVRRLHEQNPMLGLRGVRLGIQDLIRDVREELAASEQARTDGGQAAMFRVEEFDLEISFIVRADVKQGAQASYQVLTVDSETRTARENVQKLILRPDQQRAQVEQR